MTKRIAIILLSTLMALLSAGAFAQINTATIKGVCKDETGKPIVGAAIEIANLDNGAKIIAKTDSHGAYNSMGIMVGAYKITLLNPDGSVWFSINNATVTLGGEDEFDFDIATLKRQAAKEAGVTEAQIKANELAKKENEKIKGLNALLAQAAAQKQEKKYDEAVATMEQAAAQDQKHDVIYASLADAYLLDKKYPEAETAYAKAIALAPPTSKALASYHSNLALALLRQDKTAEGVAECEKTAQLDPAQAGQCYFNAGAVLTNQGKVDEANQAFDKAIAADPTKAEAYYQKGLNLAGKPTPISKDGKPVPAPGTVEALTKYLELAPTGKNAETAKAMLAYFGEQVQTSYGTEKKSRKR